jgi:putative transposase
MPRVGRIYQRALCYHVLNRGVNRQPIFLDDADREYFMRLAQEIGSYLVRCGRYIERNPVRAGLITPAWAYAWSSARHYVEGSDDGLTDTNPYLGPFDAEHRREYGEALMSGIDDEFIRRFPRGSPIGGDVFAGSLRRDRGRQRVKRGRPTRSVFISSKHVANE